MTNVQRPGPPILVGVDGSESARRAVRWAAQEARRRRVPLRLVHAYGATTVADLEAPDLSAEYRRLVLKNAAELLASAAELVPPEVAVATDAIDDHPLPRLVAEAERAQLAVIGDRGLRHSHCPVAVVRPGTRP
jgi:nucleotide-binding universal stress UspA family protein